MAVPAPADDRESLDGSGRSRHSAPGSIPLVSAAALVWFAPHVMRPLSSGSRQPAHSNSTDDECPAPSPAGSALGASCAPSSKQGRSSSCYITLGPVRQPHLGYGARCLAFGFFFEVVGAGLDGADVADTAGAAFRGTGADVVAGTGDDAAFADDEAAGAAAAFFASRAFRRFARLAACCGRT